ncbi:MAG: hypothetical protein AAF612_05135 [Planctomycetota bacterium]
MTHDAGVGPAHGPGEVCHAIATRAAVERMPVVSTPEQGAVALALPVLDRGRCTAVSTFWLEQDDANYALELWRGQAGRAELMLSGARYGGLDRFAKISQYVGFPRGAGLPGRAWEQAQPLILGDLTRNTEFLRSSGAESEGLDAGLGLPVIDGAQLRGVLLQLSSLACPVARAMEVWSPGRQGDSLRLFRRQSWSAQGPLEGDKPLHIPAGDGWIGQAWATRRPQVASPERAPNVDRPDLEGLGVSCGLAHPVIYLDDVRSVVVWLW